MSRLSSDFALDTTTLLNAELAGRYVIEREIGRGGMATVFLARDVRHDRLVALKVLDPELGAVLGVERFLAEIKVTANLQHPNLLPLFDSGEAGGLLFYVMPYVNGETLRARLERETQLPLDDVVRIATAVANALDCAHEHGVIHRDLKPENVLLQAGQPIVADFGIALAVSNAGGTRITQTGLSLGTPQYMSPEQATGDREIDARSDIYALGAIAYEMLTGEPPHTGSTAQAIIARLITEPPRSVRATRPAVPEHVDLAVLRALEKLPADRWATAAAFRTALTAENRGGTRLPYMAPRRSRAARMGIAAAALAVLAAAVIIPMLLRPPAAPVERYRFSIPGGVVPVTGYDSPGFAISGDGSMIAYAATDSLGGQSLWIRRFDESTGHQVAGSDGAAAPFWSPDGTTVGFFVGNTLERYTIGDTGPSTIATVSGTALAGAWMAHDVIVFTPSNGPLLRISASGGVPVPVTTLDSARGEIAHVDPVRLADGRHFLFDALSFTGGTPMEVTMVGSVDGGPTRRVTAGNGWYAAPDHLLVVRNGDLKALDFDQSTYTVHGDGVTIATGEDVKSLSAATNGTLVWTTGSTRAVHTSLDLYDRHGTLIRTVGPVSFEHDHQYYAPRFSPDGRRIAIEHHLGEGGGDLYVLDAATGTATRETFVPTTHNTPGAWSPDGRRIVINSTRTGAGNIEVKTVGASDGRVLVPPVPEASFASDWSRDGRTLLFDRPSTRTENDVWEMPVTGGAPRPLLATKANEMEAAFSPDGKWIAYASDETGRFEVYVRRYPLTGEEWKVSQNGGEAPRWRADGKELFFLSEHGGQSSFMSASVDLGGTFRSGAPVELFRKPLLQLGGFLRSMEDFDVSPDGQRVVVVTKNAPGAPRVPQFEVFVHALSRFAAKP